MRRVLSKLEFRHHLDQRCQVQLLSDLHLEIGQQYSAFTFPASTPFLVLAGDIGRLIDYEAYRSFFESQVSRYKNVFLVLGNHEFYGPSYHSGLDEARRLSQEPSLLGRLVLLHRARWDDPDSDLGILGCTVWSAIPEETYGIVESKHNAVHQEEVAWLREQVQQAAASTPKRRLLIATHHTPCVEGTARQDQVGNPWSPAFATDLVQQEGWGGVKAWVFGHTHYSSRMSRNGIQLVSNQRGYVLPGRPALRKEGGNVKNWEDFDPALVVAV
ncbi:Metallo-dependent phosphatase-like protein [Chaetomium sp. MPI-CAGE-AT-0009]|nr:Metallo-dependent phosphatase-like protein [Chaetomium sp. MPI-CAGE-AT-0009]